MGIFIIFAVADLSHQSSRCIADMERNRQRPMFIYNRFHRSVSGVYAVALRGCRQIDGSLNKRQISFRMAEVGGVRVGGASVIRGSVLAEGVEIAGGAQVTDSVLLGDLRVPAGEQVHDEIRTGGPASR